MGLLLHHAAHFYAVGQGDAEGVETGSETAEVEGGLPLEDGHASACVVEDIYTDHILIGIHCQFTSCRVRVEGEDVRGSLYTVGVVRHAAFGFSYTEGEVIDVEKNPFQGLVISIKDKLGRIFFGQSRYFLAL